jgi:hypothetical protein
LQDGAEAPVVVVEGSPAALDSDSLLDEELVARLAELTGRPELELREQIAATVAEHAVEFGVEANRAAMRLQDHLRQGLARSGILDPLGWAAGKLRRQARERNRDRHEAEVRATSEPEIERSLRQHGVELACEMLGDERPPEVCMQDPKFVAFLNGHDVRDKIHSMGTLGMASWMLGKKLATTGDLEPLGRVGVAYQVAARRERKANGYQAHDACEGDQGPVINGHAEVVAEPVVAEPPIEVPAVAVPDRVEQSVTDAPLVTPPGPPPGPRHKEPAGDPRERAWKHEPTPPLPCPDYWKPPAPKQLKRHSTEEIAASAKRLQARMEGRKS